MKTNASYPGADSLRGMYRPTGEFRQPKKGEFFLSGAVIEAYKAPNDLSCKYHIAVKVDV